MTNLHPFGTIKPQDFPPAPPCKTGYKWIDGGEVKLIPTESWESDYDCDSNTKKEDYTNYTKIESNLKTTGFDHSFEPGYGVPNSKTGVISGKSGRTRHKIFSDYDQKLYPVRLMEPIPGYDERVSSFSVAINADLAHKPARSLSMEQIAQQMWAQKEQKIAWYHGQTVNPVTGEVVYGDNEFDYAYDHEFKINQVFWHEIPRGKIRTMIERGFSTCVKINDKDEKIIKNEMKDHNLGNGNDGYKITTLCMDDPGANAPAKLWALFINPDVKVRHILFTKKATTADEVKQLRESWRKTLVFYAETVIGYSMKNEYISPKARKEYVQERLSKLFENFELYSYNHLEDEKNLVKIDIFRKYV